jgi:hypothetical protein
MPIVVYAVSGERLSSSGRLMMEAVRISETSVNFNLTTWHCIPEDSKLQHKIRLYDI